MRHAPRSGKAHTLLTLPMPEKEMPKLRQNADTTYRHKSLSMMQC